MKKSKILFVLIVLIISNHSLLSQTQCGWNDLSNAPFLNNYKHDDIYFVNPDIGWVVNGPVSVGDSGMIHKTTNGGQSWTHQFSVLGSRFRSVGFVDSLKGFVGNLGAGISSSITDTNIFYQTIDGGNTWNSVQNLTGPRPKGICGINVVNDTLIYAVGRLYGPSRFIRSNDGGNTWISQDMSAYAGMLIDLYFWTPDSGIVVGGTTTNYSTSRGVVLFTSDAGQSWQTKHTTNSTGGTCWKISFPSSNVGYVSWETYNTPVIFLKTIDGGQSWQEKHFSNSSYETEAIGFVNDTLGWMGVRHYPSFQTTDGGDTWQQGFVGSFLNRFRFFNDTLAYACGETVYKYSGFIAGCTNPFALNYDSLICFDDGSCINPILGCTINTSPNYNPLANTTIAHGGALNNSFSSGGFYSGNQHLIFDSDSACIIKSAKFYADSNNIVTFELRDSVGTVLDDTTHSTISGEQVLSLNFQVPVGSEMQLGISSGNYSLYRNNAGANYPYDIGGLISITSSSVGGNYYYFYYDIEVETPCIISTGIHSQGLNKDVEFQIYPNPSQDIFNITFISNEKQNLQLRVLNMLGEEIYTENLESFIGNYTKQIILGKYPKAIYFLEIETDYGVINKKLILQ